MTPEEKRRRADVLKEFLRNPAMQSVFDQYLSEATDALTSAKPMDADALIDAAVALKARKDFLLTMQSVLKDAAFVAAGARGREQQGEPV